MIIVAFFMLSSTACSSDEETEKSEVFHYETTFLAHNWQISALYQRVGRIFIDVKEAPLFCRMRTGNDMTPIVVGRKESLNLVRTLEKKPDTIFLSLIHI